MSDVVSEDDRDVCFDVDGTATYGTVHIPAHRDGQRLAAALLLAGSGPTDRNGDVPSFNVNPRTLKLIADVLGGLGIMSLRFDKYFSGQTGGGAYAADPGRIDLDAYIRQAVAAYNVLGAQPETREDALLIAGHSEGGMYALLVAQSVRPCPAGVALIEPQAEQLLSSIELQTSEQLNAAVAAGRIEPAVAAQNAEGLKRAIGDFRAGRPVDTSGLLPDIVRLLTPELLTTANERYVREDDAVRPTVAAAGIAPGTRVLVTAGTRDTNVPVSTIQPLAEALVNAGATGPGLRVLDGVDHFLHITGEETSEPVLAPAAVTALTEWARPYAVAGA
jgi:acetyl esterase/lipase